MDIVTYTKNTSALVAECKLKLKHLVFKDEDTGVESLNLTNPIIKRNGTTSVSLVRVDVALLAELKTLTSLKVLVEVDDGGDYLATMTASNRKLYDLVHDQTPRSDGEGSMIDVSPYIGFIA